jgi:hypothetical protein
MPVNQDKSSFYYEPQVRYLYQVLEDLERGVLRIPAFQRPFVWDDDDRSQLLESIRDGLPIGALLQWTAKRDVVHVEEEIAGKKVPTSEQPLRQYLLDGKQRMTTLFGALKTTDNWAVRYDLKEEQFLVASKPNGKNSSLSEKNRLLPMSVLLDSVALVRFQRGIHAENDVATDVWVRRSDELAKAFREYKLSIIVIATDNVETATKTFQRINSLGQRLTETHMVNALTWSKDFSLVKRLEQLVADKLEPIGWGDLDETLLFRSVKVAIGLDAYDANPDRIAGALSKNVDIIEEVGRAFVDAIEFLRIIGVTRPNRLPYTHQLQMLAEAFRVSPVVDRNPMNRLYYWFWITTLDQTFSRPGGSLVTKMYAYVRGLLNDEIQAWPSRRAPERAMPPERFDSRHARSKGIVLLMKQSDGEAFRLFSRSELSSQELYDSPANRILCGNAEDATKFSRRMQDADSLVDCSEIIANQIFPSDAILAAREGRLDDCVKIRASEIERIEIELFWEVWTGLNLDAATDAPF